MAFGSRPTSSGAGELLDEEGLPSRALEVLRSALAYPANLDVGPPSRGGGSPKVFFHVGLAYRGLGNADEASSYFEKAGAIRSGLSEQAYYRRLGPGGAGS